jgi:hypothetical protein
MRCESCDSEELFGVVNIRKALPMAKRGGSVKVGGQKISQVDMKDAWDSGTVQDPKIKGPIFCGDCDTEHFYVTGAPSNPYVGSYRRAIKLGAQHFIDGGTLEDLEDDEEVLDEDE